MLNRYYIHIKSNNIIYIYIVYGYIYIYIHTKVNGMNISICFFDDG